MKAYLIAGAMALGGSLAMAAEFPEFPTMPEQQKRFIAAIEAARDTYSKGANDMAKGAARPARAKEICSILKGSQPKAWVGVIYDLSTNGDGKGVMEVTIGPNVYVKTWNNSLSDISDKTLIDPSSPLFQSAVVLKEGQKVILSGTFFKSPTDCVKEGSLTLRGTITEPEFIIRFSSIKPLDN
ncbi:hypothetical protein V5G24_00035 [Xanthobacter sp. VTT E-85241]|uniref:hypothetical protein n=1 Tax=Roseixanthobacter finlandensis TaxID=3119922 RepID=UPI00372C335A